MSNAAGWLPEIKRFFFEKKNQKTSFTPGHGRE
jgi:hypothetical protein